MAASDTACECRLFTSVHIRPSAGSVLALLQTSSPPQKRYVAYMVQSCCSSNNSPLCWNVCCSFIIFTVGFSSFADTDPLRYSALFTHHIAAPVKLAVAAFTPRLLQDVVASSTAQTLAVVHSGAGLVADATLRSRRVWPQVPLAEIRWLLKVHQFVDVRPPPMRVVVVVLMMVVMVVVMIVVVVMAVVVRVVQLSSVPVVSLYKRGDVEALFENGTHQPELWRDLPASLQLAAAWCPVALAFPSHVVEHHLQDTHRQKQPRLSEEVSRGKEVKGGAEKDDSWSLVLLNV